jgi:hypothetical protein
MPTLSRLLRYSAFAAVAASAPLAAASQPLTLAELPARTLAAQNVQRASLGVPPLAWDKELAIGATAYAEQMALTNLFEHSNRSMRPGIGENLWMGSHGVYSLEAMVGGWASEKRLFMPGVFPANSRSGNWMDVAHYTQMVWPTTARVGCGLATNGRIDYLVCRYATKGNVDGKWVGPALSMRALTP